ncbi:MAG TPA: glycosyltransferase [Gemmatimonadales bacterium]|nr:glycosyltransferase [Gemmatimonadales bacterium]
MLTVTNMWPRPERPGFGTFVHSQVASLADHAVETEVHVIPGDRSAAAYFSARRAISRAVRQWRPVLVHAHFGLSGWSVGHQQVPLVLSVCGDDLLGAVNDAGTATLKSRVMTTMTRAAARRAAAIICKSPNLRDALPEALQSRAVVIPNGVDLRLFRPGSRHAARAQLGLDPTAEYVLFPHDHRQPVQKRFCLADAAMTRLRELRPHARLLHVSGEPAARMPDYYRAANCLLLTSRSEGSPNTVKEALASNIPVVSVDVGDVAQWLARCQNCRLVDADAEALALALNEILARDEPAGAEAVLADIDLAAVARRIRAVYDHVLDGFVPA